MDLSLPALKVSELRVETFPSWAVAKARGKAPIFDFCICTCSCGASAASQSTIMGSVFKDFLLDRAGLNNVVLHTLFVRQALPKLGQSTERKAPASVKGRCETFCDTFALSHPSHHRTLPPCLVQVHAFCHSGRDAKKLCLYESQRWEMAVPPNGIELLHEEIKVESFGSNTGCIACFLAIICLLCSTFSSQESMHPPLLWAMKQRLQQVDWSVNRMADHVYVADSAGPRAHQDETRSSTKG